MMTRFYCLPAQAIQAPRLFCSTQSSYPCCSWTHTPRQWALSTCLVCLAQHRPADELCAELDWTRLSRRREVVFLRISRAKPQCRDSKKGAGETANSFCSRQWPKQPVTRLDCVPANGSNDLLVDSFRTDGASSDEERTGNYADRVTPSTSGYMEKGFYISPKEGQRVRDCPVDRLHELLLVAQQELENARANSAKLEETAQRIAEEAFVVRDQAVEAENAASDAQLNLDITVKEEARLQDAAERARAVFTSAGVKVMLAEDALAEVLDKLNADQSDQAIRQLRTSVALYPAEVPLASKGLMVNTSLESIALEQKFVRNAGASGNSEENAPQVMAFVNESEEVTFSPVTQSGIGDIAGDGQNGMSPSNGDAYQSLAAEKGEELSRACAELRHAESEFQKLEDDLARTRILKAELLKLTTHLSDVARQVRENASSAHDDAAYAMSLAEQAVAWEVEAAQRLSDAEMALQKAETHAADAAQAAATVAGAEMAQRLASQVTKASELLVMERDPFSPSAERTQVASEACDNVTLVRDAIQSTECSFQHAMVDSAEEFGNSVSTSNAGHKGHVTDTENKVISETESDSRRLDVESIAGDDNADKPKVPVQLKRPEVVKETTSPGIPKAAKRSSRFFSASYFSFAEDGAKFFPSPLFSGLAVTLKQQLPKVVIGIALLLAGGFVLNNQLERQGMVPPSDSMSSVQDVTTNANLYSLELSKFPRHMKKLIDKLPLHKVNEEETSLFDVLWLLLASVIFVPIFQNMPGGSPVLGYLAAGVLIGPYTLSIIQNVHGTKAIAEFGVVFLLFNIGLELSVERLSSMKKYVFGFGSSQVLCTALCIGLFAHQLSSISVPAAIVIGNGLALSSTAVVLQVLQERGESTSRHGRATFSVLLFQDLAVVVLLILIPLVSPNSSKGGVGLQAIGEALGIAAIKGVIAISGIIAGGRLLLRPVYKRMAENHNPEIFAANTLLIVLGTSLLTARAGLSMALGAFLAGLLLAETEYALQVESDIAPYRGLLLGLFFMTVGMSIDPKLFIAKFPVIFGALALLLCGKTLLVACVGRQFGLSTVAAVRAGLLLSPGGEFAFVAFGEAVNQGIMSSQLSSLLFLVVGLSMALTPWLAAGGQLIASRFEQQDVRSLLPAENETDDLQDHIIICGFGRVGQIIGQLLAERLIPFVALDVRSERVNMGRALDLPVYFGDAGSREVLHKVGAERAAAAVITLDTPGANYRTVWALSKHFPRLKTFVRAHDIDHGISLEKAGATAVVPEILEPSLQLAAAVLAQAKLPASEIAATIDDFRSRHLSELSELSEASGTSLGYGFSKIIAKPKPSSHEGIAQGRLKNDDGSVEIADGGIVSVGI